MEEKTLCEGVWELIPGDPTWEAPLLFALRPSQDSHSDLRRRPRSPTTGCSEQWCHLVDGVRAAHGGGGGDPSLEVLMTGWGGASAPSWAGQRLPLPPPGLRNSAFEPLGRDPTEDPEGTPNLPRPHLTAPGGLQLAKLEFGNPPLSLL